KEKEVQNLKEKLKRLKNSKDHSIEELRSFYIDQLQKRTTLNNEEKYTEKAISQTECQESKKTVYIEETSDKCKELNYGMEKVEQKEQQLQTEIDVLLKEYHHTKEQYEHEKILFQQKETAALSIQEKLQKNAFQRKHLEEWQENYSGYYSGVRHVMQHKD